MKIIISNECPQEVKVQLQKWLECGWLTAESVENEVEDVNDVTPPPSKSRNIEETQDPIEMQWVKRLKDIASKIAKELDNQLITKIFVDIPALTPSISIQKDSVL